MGNLGLSQPAAQLVSSWWLLSLNLWSWDGRGAFTDGYPPSVGTHDSCDGIHQWSKEFLWWQTHLPQAVDEPCFVLSIASQHPALSPSISHIVKKYEPRAAIIHNCEWYSTIFNLVYFHPSLMKQPATMMDHWLLFHMQCHSQQY